MLLACLKCDHVVEIVGEFNSVPADLSCDDCGGPLEPCPEAEPKWIGTSRNPAAREA